VEVEMARSRTLAAVVGVVFLVALLPGSPGQAQTTQTTNTNAGSITVVGTNSNTSGTTAATNGNTQATFTGSNQNSNPNPGRVPRQITREEAERLLPPPLPIVNIANPHLVYNSPDEVIRAAVADWLGRIKQPHDQFGNLITPNYRSAQVPDRVDAGLIRHILEFSRGRRLIAFSAAAVAGIVNQQQNERQDLVDQIIVNGGRLPANANLPFSEPFRPGQNTSIPGTGGGDGSSGGTGGGGTGGTGGGGTGGGGGSNTPVGGGNENVPNLNNNNGSTGGGTGGGGTGGGTVAELETKYGIRIASQPKPFTAEELQLLDRTLAMLPRSFYQGTTFERHSIQTDASGQTNPNVFADATNTGATSGRLRVYDLANSTNASQHVDFTTPPFDANEGRRLQYMATIAHELTHIFQFYGEGRRFTSTDENPRVQSWARTFGWTFDSANQRWQFDQNRRQERPTNYAVGTAENPTDPAEDMAESMMFYLLDPARLRQTATAASANGTSRFNFIRDQLQVVQQPDAPVTQPPPGFR
jgi:hypothetical protein